MMNQNNVPMLYQQKEPSAELSQLVKCFWLVDSENDDSLFTEKIIPDGYPEMIFHYKSPYQINIDGIWKLQAKSLLAGQMRHYFFLKNTGTAGMVGIKFQPAAIKKLFNVDMSLLTNKVVPLSQYINNLTSIHLIAIADTSFEKKVAQMENELLTFKKNNFTLTKGERAVQLIIECQGLIKIEELLKKVKMNERTLERYFKSYIGIPPKFYSRIIRFANIFKHVNQGNQKWTDIAYMAGFYDQSHFIKNFKEFTGEDPSKYGFTKKNMANFFLSTWADKFNH